jgi:DNA mismatch endonuclease (patch repair protein)
VRESTLESLAFTLNKIFLLHFSTQAQSDDLQDRTIKRYEIPEEEPMMAAEDVSTE